MSKLKNLAANCLLLFVSVMIAGLFGEFAIRMISPQVTFFPRYIESHEFPIAFPKSAELTHSQGGLWKFTYHTNVLGHRGPYRPPTETTENTNVIVLGDSFTFGIGVNDHEVYTQVVADELGNEFYILNGGMGGFGIDSEIKWYFKTGQLYNPRYVVLQFTANDPGDSFSGVTKIENGEFTFHPIPRPKPAWQRFLSRSSIIQKSHIYSALRRLSDSFAAGKIEDEEKSSSSAMDQIRIKQENYIEMLDLFANYLQAQGVELLLVSVTHTDESNYRYDLARFPMIRAEVERLRAAGLLHFVDLPLERMAEIPGSHEGHQWSAAHHEIVGKAIAAKIFQTVR